MWFFQPFEEGKQDAASITPFRCQTGQLQQGGFDKSAEGTSEPILRKEG